MGSTVRPNLHDAISAEAPSKSANPLNQPFTLVRVRTEQDLAATAQLFRVYVRWLGHDLSFQGFEEELASLPGKYSPQRGGELLLVRDGNGDGDGDVLGCVALRALPSAPADSLRCEMKRLYVTDAGRGRGLGRALTEAVVGVAREHGYREMLLDTLAPMEAARAIYKKLGFREVEAYYETELPDTVFLCLQL